MPFTNCFLNGNNWCMDPSKTARISTIRGMRNPPVPVILLRREIGIMDHIAVAIEFDEELEDIIDFTRDLVRDKNTEVHVVHAYQPNAAMVDYGPYLVDAVQNYENHLQNQAESVREIVRKLINAGIKAHGYMKPINKNVVDSILEFSKERVCELIVVGSHHPGRMERLLLGSTTENIVRGSDLPVVVVPRRSGDG